MLYSNKNKWYTMAINENVNCGNNSKITGNYSFNILIYYLANIKRSKSLQNNESN